MGIQATIRQKGMEPQEYGVSGLPRGDQRSFDQSREVMRQCDDAVIIALEQSSAELDGLEVSIPWSTSTSKVLLR
jgi:hypothetical protein